MKYQAMQPLHFGAVTYHYPSVLSDTHAAEVDNWPPHIRRAYLTDETCLRVISDDAAKALSSAASTPVPVRAKG